MLVLETYNLDDLKDISRASGTSKGNQSKWYDKAKNCWIKRDMFGYEGVAEFLASIVLEHSILHPTEYVRYRPCLIQEQGQVTNGCYSPDFRGVYTEVTLYRLFEHYNLDMQEFISRGSYEDKYNRIVEQVFKLTNLNIHHDLSRMLAFDALILNEDRHFNNIFFLYNKVTNRWQFAPIFDNGLAFLSDTKGYSTYEPPSKLIRKVKSRPFSTSFNNQVKLYQGDPFIDSKSLLTFLNTKGCDLGRAETVLRIQLRNKRVNHILF